MLGFLFVLFLKELLKILLKILLNSCKTGSKVKALNSPKVLSPHVPHFKATLNRSVNINVISSSSLLITDLHKKPGYKHRDPGIATVGCSLS